MPESLFGRLLLLVLACVLISHALALTLMSEFRVQPPMQPPQPGALPPPGPLHGPPPGPFPGHRQGLNWMLVLDVGIRLSILSVAAWIGARWLSAPIRAMSQAAQRMGRDVDAPPLPEAGPRECRDATRMFNQMHLRIQRQLIERDQFVAAISHDLRTPLTRIWLRAEDIEDRSLRARLLADVREMELMIRSTLDHLRDESSNQPRAPIDLVALVDSLADDVRDAGHGDIRVTGTAAPLVTDPLAVRRAVDNLLQNAIRHATTVEINVHEDRDGVTITLLDDGPGIPEHELGHVLRPYYQVAPGILPGSTRSGLGLAIVNDIAARLGGRFSLLNRSKGGLAAALWLPRSAGDAMPHPPDQRGQGDEGGQRRRQQ